MIQGNHGPCLVVAERAAERGGEQALGDAQAEAPAVVPARPHNRRLVDAVVHERVGEVREPSPVAQSDPQVRVLRRPKGCVVASNGTDDIGAENDARVEETVHEQLARADHCVVGWGDDGPSPTAVTPDAVIPAAENADLGVGVHEADLLRETFGRVGVVCIGTGHERGPAPLQPPVQRCRQPEILIVVHNNEAPVPRRVRFQDRACAIGARVVNDDQFEVFERLCEQAI